MIVLRQNNRCQIDNLHDIIKLLTADNDVWLKT